MAMFCDPSLLRYVLLAEPTGPVRDRRTGFQIKPREIPRDHRVHSQVCNSGAVSRREMGEKGDRKHPPHLTRHPERSRRKEKKKREKKKLDNIGDSPVVKTRVDVGSETVTGPKEVVARRSLRYGTPGIRAPCLDPLRQWDEESAGTGGTRSRLGIHLFGPRVRGSCRKWGLGSSSAEPGRALPIERALPV